jgi:competence protein ComEC
VLSVSFAAQIGTFPFIWYYFGTFPLYFLATNLLVVPSAFIIMLLAVVLLLFFYVDILRVAVAYILDTLISAVNDALRFIESLPYSSLQLPYIDAWLVCVVITAILALGYAVINKRWRYIVVTLVATLIVGGYTLYRSNKNVEPHIVFFNSRGFSAVQIVESRKCSYLLSTYPQLEVDGRYSVEPYCRREGICEPLILPYCSYNDYADENIAISNGLLTYAHRRVKMLSDQDWESESSIQPVDCIVLCRGFSGSIKELVLRYPTRYIVLDATLYSSSVKRIQRECKNIGLRCVNIAKSGAHKFLVNKTGVRIVPVE